MLLWNYFIGWWFVFKVCVLGFVLEVWSFVKVVKVLGKFGGVVGVFVGVIS